MGVYILFLKLIYLWPHPRHAELPQPGIELMPPALEARSLNHQGRPGCVHFKPTILKGKYKMLSVIVTEDSFKLFEL